ncbi:uncharacterized protein F5Z01DRAFT_677768 [Emericellopsis atlantica]|uniref:Uncharacterized protein n=1 Tax=Emericellopsis atlantica TaxID=2614577 RepID=A0A9P8CKE2_9HYPO|nr:uncharacterized protein F5Z01DRAFT_677768 [Emericellopsis atlantica]KAG9250469.1 hypothetical protein F5Z01DRAFT_677768 [Emericellopsis atlantica]
MKAGIVVLVAAAAAYVIPRDASHSTSPTLALERRTPKTARALTESHHEYLAAIADAEGTSRLTKLHERRKKRSPEEPLHLDMRPAHRYYGFETPEQKQARLEAQLVDVAQHLLDRPIEGDDPADYMHPELKEKWLKYVKDDAEKKNPPKTPNVKETPAQAPKVEPPAKPDPMELNVAAEPEQPLKPTDASTSESSPDEQYEELEPTAEDGVSDEVEPQEPEIQPEQQETLEEDAKELQEPQKPEEPEVQSEEQVIAEDETSDEVDPPAPEEPSDEQVQPAETNAPEEVKPNKKEEVPKEVKKAHKTAKPPKGSKGSKGSKDSKSSKGSKGPKYSGKKSGDIGIDKLLSGAVDNIRKGMGKGLKAGSAIAGTGVPAAAVLGAASVGPEGLTAATGPGTAAVGGEELAKAKVPGTESLAEALNLGGVGKPADAVIEAEALGNTDYLATSEALSGADGPGKGHDNLPSIDLDLVTPGAEAVGAETDPATKGHSVIGTGSKILGATAFAGGVASKIAEGVTKLSNPLPNPPANATRKQDEVQAEMELGPSTLYEGDQEEDQDEEDREPDDRDDFDMDLIEADQDGDNQDVGNAGGAKEEKANKVLDFFGKAAKRLLDILKKLRALQVESKSARKKDKANAKKQKAIDDAEKQKDQETPQKKQDKDVTQKQKVKENAQKKKGKVNAQKQKDKASAHKHKDKETPEQPKVKETPPKQKGVENILKQKGPENPLSQKNKENAQRLAELRQGAGERLKATAFGDKELGRMGFAATGNEVAGGESETKGKTAGHR